MGKAEVLSLLRDGEYVSGEEISRALGVTRAAVWKAVQALRAAKVKSYRHADLLFHFRQNLSDYRKASW